MSQFNEAEDFGLFSVQTDARIPESGNDNIIQFENKKKVLDNSAKINFSAISYNFFKRAVDITASSLALILLSPVFLATSLAIKKDSNGPVLLKQERIGKDGKNFTMFKFRSMVENADEKLFKLLEEDEQAREEYKLNKKLKDDPRITKVGNFIRKTSIDELPQLINVLKGDMSLVGPRPYLPREMEDMGKYYDTIVESKPGITGLWQVSGRSNTTFDERLIYDQEYSENKGFFYDMGLLTKTVGVVLNKDGAK